MLMLPELIQHARRNPTRSFPLDSCSECLAADMTGKSMGGHYDGVDPRFAKFTATIARESFKDESMLPSDVRGCLTGEQIADALERIEAGTSPIQAAHDAWANRSVP